MLGEALHYNTRWPSDGAFSVFFFWFNGTISPILAALFISMIFYIKEYNMYCRRPGGVTEIGRNR